MTDSTALLATRPMITRPAVPGGPDAAARAVAAVERRLAAVIDEEAATQAGLPDAAALFADLRAAVLGAGKRLRPSLCHWGYVGVAGPDCPDQVVRAGAALELLHAGALVHDDLMDGSASRRGRPTLHRRRAGAHARSGWAGDPERFGTALAVLVGHLAVTLAHRLAATLPPVGQAQWQALCAEIVAGQHLDLLGAARRDRDPALAKLIAALKSGRYTVVRPLQLGGGLAGGEPWYVDTYAAYGEPLGVAFQFRDDLLGAFGDPRETGKPSGDDVRSGKPTLLLAIATERAGPAQRRVLSRVGRADTSETEVAAVLEVLIDTGARAAVERLVVRRVEAAIAALADPRIHPEVVGPLTRLGHELARS